MIKIYPEHLYTRIHEELCFCYLLIGNDPLLLQESYDTIRACAQQHGFTEHLNFVLDNSTDWDIVFGSCQSISMFSSRQTLTLTLPEDGPNTAIAAKLEKLSTLLHNDILLIIIGVKLTKAQENSHWYKAINIQAALVPCVTPEYAQLQLWIAARAEGKKLDLHESACQLLCHYYEGNLLALTQVMDHLSLLWPDGKLTLARVEKIVNNATHFTPFHWVDALLAGKSKRALHILRQLATEESNPVILLRTVQRELLLLLILQRQESKALLPILFNQYRTWQNRRILISNALQRLSLLQIHQSIQLLTRLEIILKQDYRHQLWQGLETLSLLLCNTAFPVKLNEF